jgi:antitoxin ChpS
MPRSSRLRKVGGSVMLAIPRPVLDELGLGPDASVDLVVRDGQLVVDPKRRRRYSLDALLAECNPKARRTREDREWTGGPPVGRELL